MVSRSASCSCGQVSIAAVGEPIKISACHCKACQRRTGSAFSVAVFYSRANVAIIGGTHTYSRLGDSGQSVEFHFCPDCASTVCWYPEFRSEWVGVAIGCFDDRTLWPTQAVYEQDQLEWVKVAIKDKLSD